MPRPIRPLRPINPITILTLALWLLPRQSQAFGPQGHQTVAYIAEDHLTRLALARIRAILPTNTDLAAIATWADEIRPIRPATAPWHYINLPVRSDISATNVSTYCTTNDLLSQFNREIATLGDPAPTDAHRLEALKFVVHFAGDLAMPLHCGDDGDRGGNDKIVRFYGPYGLSIRGRKMKLHALWDHLIQVKATDDPRRLATRLERRVTQTQIDTWRAGTPETWLLDAFDIAQKTIYKALPPGPTAEGQAIKLPRRYYAKMRPIDNQQLQKAGIHLATILNRLFDPITPTLTSTP